MQKSYRSNSIPDLRRKTQYRDEIDLRYLGMRYFVPMIIMITIVLVSAMMVAATPNSNFPASI
ncbi:MULTISPECIES: hypothetical protein [Methanobacterium]|jgi:hypothetical protein|uniref:Putative membrane protein n=1 Tax=Methanobacterium formicicum TaxID=2162 RepID=A0A089ZUY5_METFO|nr:MULTISPECIES: hypothetical protein [Methanobacterium]AIS31494.1 hypothetical protein BRM9_0673 [Methanobacterium formicicum]CEL25333.1 putative membrane protein [Methanobacterium formicicum]